MADHLTTSIGSRDHVRGSRQAPVVLVEYGDYQCPYSGLAHPIIKELERRFGDSLAFVFRNFPLVELHPDALRAAETAEWAGLSHRFWPMHDYLFEHQTQLSSTALLAAASSLRLERHQLEVAWHDHALRHRVGEDVASGTACGVRGTPTFFLNGELYEGSWDGDTLGEAVRDAGGLSSHAW